MALKILCSAKYIKTSKRMFDKVTQEYDPPSYWFRLKAIASGKIHKSCTAEITSAWTEKKRGIAGVDPIKMFWLSEPNTTSEISDGVEYFAPDLLPGKGELLGLAHIKLYSNYRNSSLPVPPNNTPSSQVPEVKLNRSKQENTMASKKMTFPYGTYFISVEITDSEGESASKIFRITTGPHTYECTIRTSRWYERLSIWMKSFISGVEVGSGLANPK